VIRIVLEILNLFFNLKKDIAPKALQKNAVAIIILVKEPLALNFSMIKNGICVGNIKNINI
jgi:hypothetical protein